MKRYFPIMMLVILGLLFAACAPATPEVITVEKEVVVEKPVVQTVVVEKEVPVEKKVVETVVVEKEKVVEKEVTVEVEKEVTVEKEVVVTATAVPKPTAPPKTLRMGWGIFDTKLPLDPQNTSYTEAFMVAANVYENLVSFNTDTNSYEPALAESWETSPDGVVWTFKLRDGVKFSTGNPVDVEAVKFSLTRPVIAHTFVEWLAKPFIDENSVEVIDERTVRVTLLQPFGGFLGLLTGNVFAIMDPEVVMEHDKDGDMGMAWLNDHSAGSGPFMLTEHIRGSRIVLERNPQYRGPAPQLERIILLGIPEASQREFMLEKGDLDVAVAIPVEHKKDIEDKGFSMELVPRMMTIYYMMNMGVKPFDNLKVRQAIRYAIDYESIIHDMFEDSVTPASGIIYEGLIGYTPDLVLHQDLEKAKALLAEAGYPDGFEAEIYTQADMPELTNVALKIQSDLAKLGIKLRYTQQVFSTLYPELNAGKIPSIIWPSGPFYRDPDGIMPQHAGGSHFACQRISWANDELAELVEEGRTTVDIAERQRIYEKAQKILTEEGPFAFLYRMTSYEAISPRVKGWNVIPFDWVHFQSVTVE